MKNTDGRRSNKNPLPTWAAKVIQVPAVPDFIRTWINADADNFTSICNEIENKLQGIYWKSGGRTLTPDEQRMLFLTYAIHHAIRFRPISKTEGTISRRSQDKLPSARKDLENHTELQSNIAQSAKSLAIQLRQFDEACQRLDAEIIECHPLGLIYDIACDQSNDNSVLKFGYKDLQALDKLSIGSLHFPHLALAEVMEQVHAAATRDSQRINPKKHLPVTSRKSTYHFYEAFEIWLNNNSVSDDGFIPDDMQLTDRCWAILSSSLTGVPVSEKSINVYRARVKKRRDDLLKNSNNADELNSSQDLMEFLDSFVEDDKRASKKK